MGICDRLGITYTELQNQPAWWVHYYLAFKEGKEKALAQKEKDDANRARTAGRKKH